MILDGFAISGYRSFGEKMVYVSDLAKVNVFIGKNNCGKSNVLRFCRNLSKIAQTNAPTCFDDKLDINFSIQDKDIKWAMQIKRNSEATGVYYNAVEKEYPYIIHIPEIKECLWIYYSKRNYRNQDNLPILVKHIEHCFDLLESTNLPSNVLRTIENFPDRLAVRMAQRAYNTNPTIIFSVYTIEAFRKIAPKDDKQIDDTIINGQDLIVKLRYLQSPEWDKMQDKDKFAKINSFLCEIIGEKEAFLEIPAAKDEIYVNIKGKVLPLENLGTGIHEVIILAAAVTVFDKAVFCIEEPEIHIHPELQKKFLKYIQHNTDNQYLISTHSNAFFDIPGVNIYHCWSDENEHTQIELVSTNREKATILLNLGYRPSDLLQSNFVIWVEGPSDRIYINHWIHGRPDGAHLEEGLHYSIMFYGGRLLSHLTFEDPEVEEFIQLCKLNRQAAIVVDRDTDSARKWINQTKKRVNENFEKNGCMVWLTDGREIENYISEATYNSALRDTHPSLRHNVKFGRFLNITKVQGLKTIDKIAIARKVVQSEPDYSSLNLKKSVDELIKRIKAANS